MGKSNEALEFPAIWAEHMHSARFFRGVTVLLGVVCLLLLWMLWGQVSQPPPEPLVVRVDAVGRAQVVDYDVDRATVDQTDPVVPFFLTEFLHSHFARRHGLGAEDWQRSHYFLTPELSRVAYSRDEQELVDFISSAGQAPEYLVEDVRIRILPQPEPPYRAEIFFDRVERYTDLELSRSTFSASVQFVFAEDLTQQARFVNPLGIIITFLEFQEELVQEALGG